MSKLVEIYVRKRGTPTDDRRTGTVAIAPCTIRIGDQVIQVDATDDEQPILIEVDEHDAADPDGEPPTRTLARVAAAPLTKQELAQRKQDGIPATEPVTVQEAHLRAEADRDSRRRRGKKA